jgi:hypothetical protein
VSEPRGPQLECTMSEKLKIIYGTGGVYSKHVFCKCIFYVGDDVCISSTHACLQILHFTEVINYFSDLYMYVK